MCPAQLAPSALPLVPAPLSSAKHALLAATALLLAAHPASPAPLEPTTRLLATPLRLPAWTALLAPPTPSLGRAASAAVWPVRLAALPQFLRPSSVSPAQQVDLAMEPVPQRRLSVTHARLAPTTQRLGRPRLPV